MKRVLSSLLFLTLFFSACSHEQTREISSQGEGEWSYVEQKMQKFMQAFLVLNK